MYSNVFGDDNKISEDIYWIKFVDKGNNVSITVSEKAIERRSVRSSSAGYSWYDIQVCDDYIRELKRAGVQIRNISRWLNAVSAVVDRSQLNEIRTLDFVDDISRVSSYSRQIPQPSGGITFPPPKISAFDYGPSAAQINIINIDSLHNLGFSGNGILIGVLDTGFDTSHTVFSEMRSDGRVLATYDFINGDSNVVDGQDVQRSHGTQVLSALGGFAEGSLIGPAYGADFVLAKTEMVLNEVQAEEDNWVAAAEWMEALGVDIISSSLGYIDWYDTSQVDGQTAVVTQAANIAVSLGVIVVNAAGNEGNTSWRKMIPPADGDSVIAVGAVDPLGEIVGFSSRGPTSDGRIKPDFCAMGTSVYLASWYGGYGFSGGTSFATPLIAGGVALLLEGHPDWTAADIIRTMKAGSSHRYLPNNTYGWGVPDFAAVYYSQPGPAPGSGSPVMIAPHPAIDSVIFYLNMSATGIGELSIHDLSGAEVNIFSLNNGTDGIMIFTWDGKNAGGKNVASGIYICQFESGGRHAIEKLFFVSNR
ncbi:MAG: S8 family serine peptidase [candidate division Zixibacteria bacterium]